MHSKGIYQSKQKLLTSYKSTPHIATGITPYKVMQNREIRTRIDYQYPNEQNKAESIDVERRDAKYKEKMKEQRENNQYQINILILGDYVLVKYSKKNKWSTEFQPLSYVVITVEG